MKVHLTRRELDVMAVVWAQGSATVGEVRDGLPEKLAYTTVLTVLRGLDAKGYLRHEEDGRAFRYFPLIEPGQAADALLPRLVHKIFSGSRELLLARLVADEDITPEELRKMKEHLEQRLGEVE